MNIKLAKLAGAAAMALGLCTSAQAAAPTSIAGLVQTIAPLITPLQLPVVGTLGNISLQSAVNDLPGLAAIPLPQFGSLANIPVINTISVGDGLLLIGDIVPLRTELPGLAQLAPVLAPLGSLPALPLSLPAAP
jgi:hypothetical protein